LKYARQNQDLQAGPLRLIETAGAHRTAFCLKTLNQCRNRREILVITHFAAPFKAPGVFSGVRLALALALALALVLALVLALALALQAARISWPKPSLQRGYAASHKSVDPRGNSVAVAREYFAS
jgi:hypothetical protein